MRYTLLMLFVWFQPVHAVEFASQAQQTTVIELYTSEGCSSCPPADKWLSTFTQDPRLFKTLLPLAFHVDYWDQLGWQDPFAKRAFSQRQRALTQDEILSQVYTPGIVVNSQEWRQWFRGKRQVDVSKKYPGVLQVQAENGLLSAEFKTDVSLVMNVAYLGMGLQTQVERGENRGRQLAHDFVVLSHQQVTGQNHWKMQLETPPDAGQKATAIAVWLTPLHSLEMIQATATTVLPE